jgi:hypothetical protein
LLKEKCFNELKMTDINFQRIPTPSKISDITERDLNNFKLSLENTKNCSMFNAQGYGISDEYQKSPIIHNIFYNFLEELFPSKSSFE